MDSLAHETAGRQIHTVDEASQIRMMIIPSRNCGLDVGEVFSPVSHHVLGGIIILGDRNSIESDL